MPSYDRTEPAASSALASSPVRGNFQALDYSNLAPNWIEDPLFVVWAAGDAASPSYWGALAGTGTAVARDTTNYLSNGMACKITLGSTTGYLPQTIFAVGELPASYQSKEISFGCWVKTSTASLAYIQVYDGTDTTSSSAGGSSGTHTGGGDWEWLYGTHTFNAAADELEVRLVVDIAGSSGNATFDLPTLIPGAVAPQDFLMCPTLEGSLVFPIEGAVSTDTIKFRFCGSRPFLVKNVTLQAQTAPTGQALIVDVNQWDSSAQSMFTTKPQIAAGGTTGGANPDGTYQRRCFQAVIDNDTEDEAMLTVDIDQVGSSAAGSDLNIYVRTLQFQSPCRAFRAFS